MASSAGLVKLGLDANVVIDLMRGEEVVRRRYVDARRSRAELFVSVIVFQELRFGSALSAKPQRQNALVDRWLAAMTVIPYEPADALTAAALQAQMQRAGRPAPLGDFFIGAHAVARDLTLVTADTRHFQNIPGLELLDWRMPPEDPQD